MNNLPSESLKEIEEYRRLAEEVKNSRQKLQIYHHCGIILLVEGDIESALNFFNLALRENEKNAEVLESIRECYYRLKDYDKLIAHGEKEIAVIELNQGVKVAIEIAGFLEANGKKKEAVNFLKKIKEKLHTSEYFLSFLLKFEKGVVSDTEWVLEAEQFLESQEDNPDIEIAQELALFYIKKNDYEKAKLHLAKLLSLSQDNFSVIKFLIDCYIRTCDFQSVINLFNNKSLPPDYLAPLLFYTAQELFKLGQHESASELVEKHLNINTNLLALELKRKLENNSDPELFERELSITPDKFFIKYIAYTISKRAKEGNVFAIFHRLLEKDAEDWNTLKQLERFIDPESQPEGLANTLEVEAQLVKDRVQLVRILLTLAQLYLSMNEPLKAQQSLTAALKIDPQNFNILKLLEKLFEESKDWNGLIEILQKETELIQDPKEVIYLNFRIGEILERNLEDFEKAGEYYEKVLSFSPNFMPALRALRRIYTYLEKWNDLLDVLQREIEITSDGNTLVNLMLERAEIFEKKLNDIPSAKKSYYEILQSSPGNPVALLALKNLLKKTSDYDGLREILLKEVGYVENPSVRADLWYELGELYETKFNDHEEALNCYYRCLKEDDNYVPAYPAVESLLKRIGNTQALKGFYNNMLEKISDREAKISIIINLSELVEDKKEKLNLYDQALKISPYHPVILDMIEPLLEEENNFQKLIDILERKIEIASNETIKSTLLLKKGIILEKLLNNQEMAIRAFEDAVERNPELLPAWENLIRIYELRGDFKNLARVLKSCARVSTSISKSIELYLKNSALNSQYLNNTEEAIESCEAVLKLDENNIHAMQELYHLYLRANRIEDAIRILEGYINFIENTEKKVKEIKKLVQLFEKIGEVAQSLNWLKEAHKLLPEDTGIILKMERCLKHLGKWDELISLYEKRLSMDYPEKIKFELHKSAGEIAYNKLKNTELATGHLESALKIVNTDRDTLVLLDKIYTEEGKREKLTEILELLIKITVTGDEQISYLRKAGRIYKDLQKQHDAIRIYEEMQRIVPEDRETLESLDSLYEATSQFEKQYNILGLLLPHTKTKDGLAEIHYKMGIAQLKLNSHKQALEHFNTALEHIPSHIPSLREKCNILRQKENFPLLSKTLIELAKYLSDKKEKSATLTEAGIILLEKLSLEEEAIKVFEEAYSLDQENLTSIIYLSKLLFKHKRWETLSNYSLNAHNIVIKKLSGMELAEFFFRQGYGEEQLGRLDDALKTYIRSTEANQEFLDSQLGIVRIELLKKNFKSAQEILLKIRPLVEKSGDRDKQFFVLFKLGITCYQLENLEGSVEYLESAKRIRSMDGELLSELAGVYELMNNWEKAALNLEEWLTLGIMDRREHYLLRLGKIYYENLKKFDRAHECFTESTRVRPDFIPGHEALIDFYYARNNWKECADQISNTLSFLKDPKERAKWLIKLAGIFYEKLNQTERAIEIANSMIKEGVAVFEGHELLAKIYTFKELWNEAIDQYNKIKEIATSADVKAKALLMKGKILKDKLNQPKNALNDFKEVLAIEPENLEAHIALGEIYDADPAKTAEAIKEHQEIILLDPTYIPSLKSLGRHYENQREYDRAYCVYSVLKIYDALDEMERVFLNSVSSRAIRRLTVPVTEELRIRSILHPGVNLKLRQLWLTVQDELDSIYPGNIEKYGITKNDLLPQKSPIDAVVAGNEVAEILGVKNFRLYKSHQAKKIIVENTSPPSIIIPERFIEVLKLDELRFLIGTYMECIASNYTIPLKIDGNEFKKFLNLVRKCFYADFKIPGMNEDEAQQQSKKIYKALSRKSRNLLQELVDSSINELLSLNFAEYQKAIMMSAIRVGFLFVNDLRLALKIIPAITEGGEAFLSPPKEAGIELVKFSEYIKDLVLYSVSNKYFDARRALKLSILS